MEIRISEKFKNLIPELTTEEQKQLEENILRDGIREPLTLWNGIIVDGHHRYEIARKHGLKFSTVEMDFSTEDEAILWVFQNQLGRRNLTDFQRVELVHRCEDAIRQKARERMTAVTIHSPAKQMRRTR